MAVVGRGAAVTGTSCSTAEPTFDALADACEVAWGPFDAQAGRGAPGVSADGELVVAGLRLGNVLVVVQPLLGIEGDPMRLLFERDLTPHPQCASRAPLPLSLSRTPAPRDS